MQLSAKVVGLGRVELPTSPLSGVRSNQLSYRPKLTGLFSAILPRTSSLSQSCTLCTLLPSFVACLVWQKIYCVTSAFKLKGERIKCKGQTLFTFNFSLLTG